MKKQPCANKKRYRNARDAHCALSLIEKTSKRENKPCRIYRCDCGYWHLTSKNKNDYYG